MTIRCTLNLRLGRRITRGYVPKVYAEEASPEAYTIGVCTIRDISMKLGIQISYHLGLTNSMEKRSSSPLRRKLTIVLLSGLIIRFIPPWFAGHPYDLEVFKSACEGVYIGGFNPFAWWTYGTVALPIVLLPYTVYVVFQSLGFSSEPVLNFLLHLPMIFGDVLVFYAMYTLILKLTTDEKRASLAASAYFLNPFVIWISSVHGMFDQIMIGLALVSLIFLLEKRLIVSSVLFSLSIATKFFPVILLPAYLYYLRRSNLSIRTFLLVLGTSTTLLFLPFMSVFLQVPVHTAISIFAERVRWSTTSEQIVRTLDFGPLTLYNVLSRFGVLSILPSRFVQHIFIYLFSATYLVSTVLMLTFAKRSKSLSCFHWVIRYILVVTCLCLAFFTYNVYQFFLWIFPFLLIEGCLLGGVSNSFASQTSIFMLLFEFSYTSPFLYLLVTPALRDIALYLTFLYSSYLKVPNIYLASSIGFLYCVSLVLIAVKLIKAEFHGRCESRKRGRNTFLITLQIILIACTIVAAEALREANIEWVYLGKISYAGYLLPVIVALTSAPIFLLLIGRGRSLERYSAFWTMLNGSMVLFSSLLLIKISLSFPLAIFLIYVASWIPLQYRTMEDS